MRVFVYYPARKTPGGGHKQMRLLARNLGVLGEKTYLLLQDPDCDDARFYSVDVPPAPFSLAQAARHLRAEDVVLLPEYRLDETIGLARTWDCRKAVYAQGGFLALLYRPKGGYRRNGIEFMIGVAPYIAALGPSYLGIDRERSFYVPYPVVRGPFAEPLPPVAAKSLSVVYMPRKLPDHIARVRKLVEARRPDVPWIEIDGVPEPEVARRLSAAAVFLSTQNGEGFGLPAVEAMSRGCIVAGYAGTGFFPHPYATAANGFWAPDRNPTRAAAQVCNALDLAREGGARRARLEEAAARTLLEYTEEKAIATLAGILPTLKAAAYGTRRGPKYRLGILGHLQAWRTLQVARRIRGKPGSGP